MLEASINVGLGFVLALLVQIAVFPVFGMHPTLPQNLKIGVIFTGVSLLRSYAVRRLFEALLTHRAGGTAPSGR